MLKKKAPKIVIGLLTLIVVCTFINYHIEKRIFSDANIAFAENTETLICGNSRLKIINPKEIKNSVNICNGAETFYFTYFNIKKALQTNKNIKNVVLPASYDNFADDTPEKGQSRFFYSKKRLKPYIKVLDTDELLYGSYFLPQYWELWMLKFNVPINFENNLKLMLMYKFSKLSQDNIPYYGTFYSSFKSNLEEKAIDEFIDISYTRPISWWAEKWFEEIIKLCQENNIRITVVATPIHPLLYKQAPQEFLETFDRVIAEKISQYDNLTFLDYTTMSFPDSSFGDCHHLNSYGAPVLAKKISDNISN